MAEYLFRPKAKADVEDIWAYTFDSWGVEQANHYVKNLLETCHILAKNPDLGVVRNELYDGLHVHPSGKHLIFYLRSEKDIDVVRILHESMDSYLHFRMS